MKVYARTPLGLAQVQVPRGQVYIIPERCKGCEICIEFCPQASRETISRQLTELADEKIISINGRHLRILNKHLLEEISKKG